MRQPRSLSNSLVGVRCGDFAGGGHDHVAARQHGGFGVAALVFQLHAAIEDGDLQPVGIAPHQEFGAENR